METSQECLANLYSRLAKISRTAGKHGYFSSTGVKTGAENLGGSPTVFNDSLDPFAGESLFPKGWNPCAGRVLTGGLNSALKPAAGGSEN